MLGVCCVERVSKIALANWIIENNLNTVKDGNSRVIHSDLLKQLGENSEWYWTIILILYDLHILYARIYIHTHISIYCSIMSVTCEILKVIR